MRLTQLLGWALASSALILAVLALRALFGRRVSACLRYALWAVVLARLLTPIYLFHIPFAGPILPPAARVETTAPGVGIAAPTEPVGAPAPAPPAPAETTAPSAVPNVPAGRSATEGPDWASAPGWLGWVWLSGSAVVAAALLFCNLRFAGKLRRARLPLEQAEGRLPVYVVPGLPSPCLSGLIRPAVYVTPQAAADPVLLRHVLAHETTHFRHGDRLWNVLRGVALAVHWWNPLVWTAAIFSRRDCELACDEGALKRLGPGERIAYGRTLLALVREKPRPAGLFTCSTTMTEGQKDLLERVHRIAHAPKRTAWAAALAAALTLAVAACSFSSPAPPKTEPSERVSPEFADVENAAATAQVNGRAVTLTMDYTGGNPDGEVGGAAFTVACGENQAQFTDDWVEETPITLAGADLGGDGAQEVVLAYTTSHLMGGLIQSLRVFDGDTLEPLAAFTRDDLPGVIFERVQLIGQGDSYYLTAPGVAETIAKSAWDEGYPTETDLMNTMAFGNYYAFAVEDGRLYCDLGIWQGQRGAVRVELGLENGGLVCKSFQYVPAATAQAARQALYRVLAQAEDVEFSSGSQHGDGVARTANVTDLWPALNVDQGGGALTPKEFAVLDLDGDGVDEAVLRTDGGGGWAFVLHCEDSGVHGYAYPVRWFNAWDLKADGTAPNSSSAAEIGVGRLHFPADGTASIEDVLYQLPVDGDWSHMRYTVNGEEVNEATYTAALEQWDAQPPAQWYAFTPENIAAVFSA